MPKTVHTPQWLKFIEPKENFFALLEDHASIVHMGLLGLRQWLQDGAKGQCVAVHKSEHEADNIKHRIEDSLRGTFVTPFDREEIYDLCEGLDSILTGAKLLVKDLELIDLNKDDELLVEMSVLLSSGTDNLAKTIGKLKENVHDAEALGNETRKTYTLTAEAYRKAMKVAYDQSDIKSLVRKKQLYDYIIDIAREIEKVGERLVHLAVKCS